MPEDKEFYFTLCIVCVKQYACITIMVKINIVFMSQSPYFRTCPPCDFFLLQLKRTHNGRICTRKRTHQWKSSRSYQNAYIERTKYLLRKKIELCPLHYFATLVNIWLSKKFQFRVFTSIRVYYNGKQSKSSNGTRSINSLDHDWKIIISSFFFALYWNVILR